MHKKLTPTQRFLLTFAALIVIGAVLLSLPASVQDGRRLGIIDAWFTSTSAVCVTGLAVTDTGTTFSPFGQVVVLLLIQAGGLGMLTISSWLLLALYRKPVSFHSRLLLEETHGALIHLTAGGLLKRIIVFTAASEIAGAVLLSFRFAETRPIGEAVWLGVFHAVSAFCNAGFCLFPDSLVEYCDDPIINLVIMGLIIIGGLGFVVCADVASVGRAWKNRGYKRIQLAWESLTLHSQVVLAASACLLVAGTLIFFIFESHNTLHDLPFYKRFLPSAFLSCTSRTAGFNTLDTGRLSNVTILFLLAFMMIGASPGSTGGGIKTTTFFILIAMIRSRLLNRPRVEFFRRSIPGDLVAKALATVGAFIILTALAATAIEYVEYGFISHSASPGRILDFLFEVVSALGTVGLSLGITADLQPLSRLVLIACMFAGRVGPLVLAASLIGQRRRLQYTLPEERLMVG